MSVSRYRLRLAVMAALIVAAPAVVLLLGFSGTAATLAAILMAALCWAPALLALEGISRIRRYGTDA